MRKSFLFMMLLAVFTSGLKAQNSGNTEQAKVNEVVVKFFDGIASLDAKMMQQYTTKGFLLLEDGAVWNMDTLTNKLSPYKTVAFSRTNHLDFMKTEVKGNTAWVAYNNTANMSVNGNTRTVQWLESAVLIKEGKYWKIQLLHSTPIKQTAQ